MNHKKQNNQGGNSAAKITIFFIFCKELTKKSKRGEGNLLMIPLLLNPVCKMSSGLSEYPVDVDFDILYRQKQDYPTPESHSYKKEKLTLT